MAVGRPNGLSLSVTLDETFPMAISNGQSLAFLPEQGAVYETPSSKCKQRLFRNSTPVVPDASAKIPGPATPIRAGSGVESE